MGIRVHKVMGYGLLRCKFGKDPRFSSHVFNPEDEGILGGDLRKTLIDYINLQIEEGGDEHYIFDLKMEKAALERKGLFEHLEDKPINSYDVIKYSYFDDEKDIPVGPLVLTIPYNKDWSRYDDAIDYHEESQRYVHQEGMVDHVEVITDCEGQPSGVYPYNGSYMHRQTGKRCKNLATMERWIITRSFREAKKKVSFKAGNDYGVNSFVEWQRHIVPIIPPFIQIFCDCFQIFKDPQMKYRLRPMVFTYWC